MVLLKTGEEIEDPRLDRIYELDWRSLNYTIDGKLGAPDGNKPRSWRRRVDNWFDQGQEGACVGFAFAHDLVAVPQPVQGVTDEYARNTIYHEAQKIDPWEGGSYAGASPEYEGTSILAGAKICTREGFFSGYNWGITAEEVARGIGYVGPSVLGVRWYEGMYEPDEEGFIKPYGKLLGGHAILAYLVKLHYHNGLTERDEERTWDDVDHERSFVGLWNSWGRGWGDDGTCKLSLRHLQTLLDREGEACFPVRTNKLSVGY